MSFNTNKYTYKNLDRFNNPIDPVVGYARGEILKGPLEEYIKYKNGLRLIHQRLLSLGKSSLFNFTGHRREFNGAPDDIKKGLAEEYVGMSIIQSEIIPVAQQHFGGGTNASVALFNRSSAAIVASMLELTPKHGRVLAIAPQRGSHFSVRLGVELAGGSLEEADPSEITDQKSFYDTSFVVLTRVTSELQTMPSDQLFKILKFAKEANCTVFIDDAYGARVAPVFLKQPRMLELNVAFGVTSCDKAGLGGPRTGLMAGDRSLIERILARGSQLGMEARAPLLLAALRSLERFQPAILLQDARCGKELSERLKALFGAEYIRETLLGPSISEDDLLELVLDNNQNISRLVPAEASSSIAMILLNDHGILTGAALERPGSRVSLRLRPIGSEISRFGGVDKAVEAIEASFVKLRKLAGNIEEVARIILGRDC